MGRSSQVQRCCFPDKTRISWCHFCFYPEPSTLSSSQTACADAKLAQARRHREAEHMFSFAQKVCGTSKHDGGHPHPLTSPHTGAHERCIGDRRRRPKMKSRCRWCRRPCRVEKVGASRRCEAGRYMHPIPSAAGCMYWETHEEMRQTPAGWVWCGEAQSHREVGGEGPVACCWKERGEERKGEKRE